MPTKKIYIVTPIGGMTIFFFILGFFVHGGLAGGFGTLLVYWAVSMTALLGIIPGIGVIGTIFLNLNMIPTILAFTGLQTSWLTDLLQWYSLTISTILTLGALYFLLKK